MAEANGKRKGTKKRSVAQLAAMGNKGLLILLIQRAFGLSRQNGFKGSDLSEYKVSAVNGVQYSLTKENGKILRLDENSDAYKAVLSKAKAAKGDVESDKLTGSVNAFINEVVGLKGAAGGGGVRSGAILKGFSFK